MHKIVVGTLCLLIACTSSHTSVKPSAVPVGYRVISEKENPASCVDAVDFAVAQTEHTWIDIFDRETQCQPDRDINLPDVDFKSEIGIAAWWKIAPCLGFTVKTTSVERIGRDVVIRATEHGPAPGACAQARAPLESFLVLRRSDVTPGSVRFVLDGRSVGTEPVS